MLIPFLESDAAAQTRLKAFEDRFRELGWIDGGNIRLYRRWAGGKSDQIRAFAKELVGLNPDVILAHSTPAVAALREQTTKISIVFANLSDPIGSGFVKSLARPGTNATGFINLEASLSGKWLQLLKEALPRLTQCAIIFNRETAPHADFYLRPFQAAAVTLSVRPIVAPVHSPTEIAAVIEALNREPNSALAVMPDTFTNIHRSFIISQVARLKVPTIYPYRYMATEGGLLSYGVDQTDMYRQAAAYVDRILRGTAPTDLPVQAPTKFELIVNLKTARELELAIPRSLLIRADEVIE